MTHRVGNEIPYTLADARYTAPSNTIIYYDMYGNPRGMASMPLTKTQMARMDVFGGQVARQNKAIESYMSNLKEIPLSLIIREIRRRRDIKALRIATAGYPLEGNEDTDWVIRSFLMGKPKKPTKAGKNKVGKTKKQLKKK